MNLSLIVLLIFSITDLIAQSTHQSINEEKIDYYANINDNYKTTSQKDHYRKVANITGSTTLVLLLVTAYSFSNISVSGGSDSPNYRALSTFFASGFASCIIGTIALIYNGKSNGRKSLKNEVVDDNNYLRKTKLLLNIKATKNGLGLVCTF